MNFAQTIDGERMLDGFPERGRGRPRTLPQENAEPVVRRHVSEMNPIADASPRRTYRRHGATPEGLIQGSTAHALYEAIITAERRLKWREVLMRVNTSVSDGTCCAAMKSLLKRELITRTGETRNYLYGPPGRK